MPQSQDHDQTQKGCEEEVVAKIRHRREKGRAKYGLTMERSDLGILAWLVHAQEEAMDMAVYLERLIQDSEILASNLHDMPEGLDFRNAGQRCDVLFGPCACGAWHRPDDLKFRIENQFYAPSVGRGSSQGALPLSKESVPLASEVEARSGFSEVHGPTRPRIHNKKMLDAIEAVIIEHSGNGLLAEEVRRFISAEASEVVEEKKQDLGEPGAV